MTAEELWKQYTQDSHLAHTDYEAWRFGGEPDTLAELVCKGIKTATCSLFYWYQYENEPLPAAGGYSVILNSKNEAVCIIQTTRIYILPYCEVSEEHASKEGEGDRSLAYWRRTHENFFSEELSVIGKKFTEDVEVICEEFELVYTAMA